MGKSNECCYDSLKLIFTMIFWLVFRLQGIVFINDFNLGRYWPLVGPQITLYLPKELLRKGSNSLILIELEKSSTDGYIQFSDEPIFN